MSYEPPTMLAELLRNWGRWCQGGGAFGAACATGALCDRLAKRAGVWGDETEPEVVDEEAALLVHRGWMRLDRRDKDTLTYCYARRNRSARGICRELGIRLDELDSRLRSACEAISSTLGMAEKFHESPCDSVARA